MKKTVVAILIIFSVALFGGVANAQNQEATSSVSKKSEAAERAKDRLEKLKARRATKSAEIKEKTRDKARRRAHVFGEISAISGTTITIETKRDAVKTVLTDDKTKFLQIGKGGKKEISLSALALGDKIAAVGIANDENSGTAKFVIKLTGKQAKRHAVFGKVSEISSSQLSISHLIHTDKPAIVVKVAVDTKIKIRGKADAVFADIKVGDKIAASGQIDDKGVIAAKRIFVIPGKFEGAGSKEATKSATPSANQ